MRSFFLFVMLLLLFSFSQELRNTLRNKRSDSGDSLKGVPIGLLFEGQTKILIHIMVLMLEIYMMKWHITLLLMFIIKKSF